MTNSRGDNESKQHESMVRSMVDEYKKDGTNKILGADLDGYPKPQELDGRIPDIIVKTSTSYIILEAETCDSIEWDDTKSQLTVFYNYATKNNVKFDMVVPKSCIDKVNKKLSEWKISASVWTAGNF
ncbi:MAG TPA: hypothetical protein VD699_06885 [Nitrosopumilaceae archaeon]|nr:hypothetical protein [Nitrosopumilaceae archaeon]